MSNETPITPTGGGTQPGSGVAPNAQPTDPTAPGNQEPARFSNDDMKAARLSWEAKEAKYKEELEKLRTAQLSDQEKQIKEAETRARSAADAEWSAKMLQTEIRAQLASKGYPTDWAAHVKAENAEGIDAAIVAAAAQYPWFKPLSAPPPGELQGGGTTASKPTPEGKWSRERLRNTPFKDQIGKYKDEIAQAYKRGEILPD